MTNLRHLVFLEKSLVSIENKDGTNLNISCIVDVAGDELFLFLLESTGVVWICYKPLVKFDETTHLRFMSFKTFEFEAESIFYCRMKHILVVTGREQECDVMLKFNSYDLSMLINGAICEQPPQLVQSTPLFPNVSDFRPERNVKIAFSECSTMVAVATEFNGIYIYKNYVVPSDDQKLWIIHTGKLFKDSSIPIKNIHILTVEGAFYLFILTEYEVVSFNLSENCVVFRESSEAKFEVSCKLRDNMVGVYKSSKIMIYNILNGLNKCINTNNHSSHSGDVTNNYINSDRNTKLYSYNEYVVNCNIDNIFDNNNIILINVYSYMLDITFIAYSYYIPRLIYVVQSMNNLYLFTTNNTFNNSNNFGNDGYGKGGKEGKGSKDNSNILIFELKNKRIYERIEILIRKRLFNWAIKLAKFENRPASEVEEIYKIYGDWLYSKNKYDKAISCYCRSGSAVEPCYVIQRFLVLNSKIYLYKYLYHLHLNNKDNYILTILLIQSLNHLNPVSNGIGGVESKWVEDELLNGNGHPGYENGNQVDDQMADDDTSDDILEDDDEMQVEWGEHYSKVGDSEQGLGDGRKELYKFLNKFGSSHKSSIKESIIECRNTNKYEFASLIARFQDDQEEYLNILIEDLNEFERAYELLERANPSIKYQIIVKHYKLLLSYNPEKLLDLIGSLFYGDNAGQNGAFNMPGPKIDKTKFSDSVRVVDGLEDDIKIDKILNIFILENKFLIKLLGIIGGTNNSLLLYTIKLNILLQQYYHLTNGSHTRVGNNQNHNGDISENGQNIGVEEKEKLEDNILKLLNNNNNSKNELIGLILCLLYNYKRGSIVMSIKMGYYNLPLILLDNQQDNINLLEYVFNYGYNEPILYINILKLLLKYNNYVMVKKLLYNIQNYKLLKYQNIINVFNNYQDVQFQYVQDYIGNEFKKINETIMEYNNDIRQDKMEYMNMKKNLVNLNSSYNVINNMNCSSCGLHLEYPSIHFYCKHSFHIYCVSQDNTCPKCSYNVPDANDNEDNFFKFLIGSNDPFDYISQQFNKFLNI